MKHLSTTKKEILAEFEKKFPDIESIYRYRGREDVRDFLSASLDRIAREAVAAMKITGSESNSHNKES